jgi:RimJ/RimL family protein N-acetyltransferase
VGKARSRLLAAVDRRGVLGVLKLACGRTRRLIYLHEEHIWHAVAVDAATVLGLPADIELTRASTPHQLEIASQTGKDVEVAREHIEEGHELWLAHDGEVDAFSCWVFHGTTPALAIRGGWLDLPARTVCLEDAVTAPDQRGRGIAPGAISAISRSLAAAGERTLVAKIEVANASSRRAFEKAGMTPTARSEMTRIGPFRHTVVTEARGRIGIELAAALRH